MSLFHTQHLAVVASFSILAVFYLIKLTRNNMIIIWTGIPWLLYMFYSSNVYLHYFLIFFPIPFLLYVLMLEHLSKIGKGASVVSGSIYYATVVMNVIVVVMNLSVMRG